MNQRGFAMISLVFWIPLIVTILFSIFWIIWLMQQRMKLNNLCHHYVLKSQEALVDRNNDIMNLNPRARWLWAEKKALDVLILTAPPPVKAAAQVRRKVVVIEQKALRTLQNGLFKVGLFNARRALYEFRKEFHKTTQDWSRYWKSPNRSRSRLILKPTNSQLAVEVRDIARVYKRKPLHWAQQRIQAQWDIPLRELLPTWVLHWVPVHKVWSGRCHSHPHSGGHLWKAAIGAGRH